MFVAVTLHYQLQHLFRSQKSKSGGECKPSMAVINVEHTTPARTSTAVLHEAPDPGEGHWATLNTFEHPQMPGLVREFLANFITHSQTGIYDTTAKSPPLKLTMI